MRGRKGFSKTMDVDLTKKGEGRGGLRKEEKDHFHNLHQRGGRSRGCVLVGGGISWGEEGKKDVFLNNEASGKREETGKEKRREGGGGSASIFSHDGSKKKERNPFLPSSGATKKRGKKKGKGDGGRKKNRFSTL